MTRIGLSYHGGKPAYDAYASALERRAKALGAPIELVWLARHDRDLDTNALAEVDAICLTGGPDVDPARYGRADATAVCTVDDRRDAIEWAILEALERHPRPLLAICRGAQILNVFQGGTLIPDLGDLNPAHRTEPFAHHSVEIAPGTLLSEIAGVAGEQVNSSHHQAVAQVAPGYRVSALAPDGTAEAFELAKPEGEPFQLAVQWHPERMNEGDLLSDVVLDAFLAAARDNVSRETIKRA